MKTYNVLILGLLLSLSIDSFGGSVCVGLFDKKSDNPIIESKTLNEIKKIETEEVSKVAFSQDRTSVRLHVDQNNQPIKTQKVILIFHGLLNSPKWMRSIEDLGFTEGNNVLSVRLENHQEYNREALDEVNYQQWILQSERAFTLAKELGTEVVVVGHSLGAILATNLALSYPLEIKQAFLLSPAIKLNKPLNLSLRVVSKMGITGKHLEAVLMKKLDRYLSSFAGMQVIELEKWYSQKIKGIPDLDANLKKGEHKLQIIIIDSASDRVVDPKANEDFSNLLKTYPNHFESSYRIIPRSEKVKHNDVPQNNNSAHEKYVLKAFSEFINHPRNY